jgi:putative ABC transport system substrate-binding protein
MTQRIARVLFSVIVISFTINPFADAARAQKKIGVLLSSEQARYRESQNGIMDQLRADGFKEPAVTFTIENANNSKARMVEFVRKFAAAKLDLIVAIGTPATIAVAKEIKDAPIVFSMVYDPVEADIAKGWKSSGNNTTGASTKLPMSMIISSLMELTPVKRLAVLYTPGEKNSETQLIDLQGLQADSKIKIAPVILTNREEIAQTLATVAPMVDAMYLTGSSVIGASVPIIVDTANKAKVVTISHLDDLVEKGALLGICVNSYHVGRLAGKKAASVLKGAKPSSIPIEVDKTPNIILNMKTVKAGQFQIPPAFMKKVTKTVD